MISLGKLLFKSPDIPFVGLPLHEHEIKEKVYLETGQFRLEVSNRHWIVCQDPFSIAVWANGPFKLDVSQIRLVVTLNEVVVGHIKLGLTSQTSMAKGNLILFKCINATSNHSTFVHRQLMLFYLRLKQKGFNVKNISNFCVTYSYPRRVILVSFRKNEYFNIFPMDFQGNISETKQYVFGLRKTNQTLEQIIEQKRLVVCEVPAVEQKIIYHLGKHHSSGPPSIDTLPFTCHLSQFFSFYIPDFAVGYSEVELDHFESLGSHMLMIGNIVNHADISSSEKQLHHIHSAHAVHKLKHTKKVE